MGALSCIHIISAIQQSQEIDWFIGALSCIHIISAINKSQENDWLIHGCFKLYPHYFSHLKGNQSTKGSWVCKQLVFHWNNYAMNPLKDLIKVL